MKGDVDIAAAAALLAEPARAAMLSALMDDTMRPASELASAAGVARSTASFHLARLGVALPDPRGRRAYARACLDWSERRHHLAGALGAALATALIDRDWLRRRDDSRALTVTPAGHAGLQAQLGIELSPRSPSAPAAPAAGAAARERARRAPPPRRPS